jgi:hypothetical protein
MSGAFWGANRYRSMAASVSMKCRIAERCLSGTRPSLSPTALWSTQAQGSTNSACGGMC